MRKPLIILFVSAFLFAFRSVITTPCDPPTDHLFSIRDIRSGLVGGEWNYQYSFYEDTCFVEDSTDMWMTPMMMRFRVDMDSVKHNEGRSAQNRTNIICTHRDNYSQKLFETLPVWGGNADLDTLHDFLGISQVPAGSTKNMKHKVWYIVESIEADTMITRPERYYTIRGKQVLGVQRVFLRTPLK